MFHEHSTELHQAVETLSRLDLGFAKAEFARAYNACLPQFQEHAAIFLREARHPLLEAALGSKGQRSVPVTVEIGEPNTLMVISGPNTGGKTVTLKTVGLAVLMAQSGLPVLALEARLPLFERVLADIGDQQSIEASLSTFSAHIVNIQNMVAVAGSNDLVLLDELGGSTEPHEGAALAVAILEHFRSLRALTIATTHHARLKAYAAQTPEAVNASMEFDEATLRPTYRLLIGLPGKSSGLEIAARLGLDPAIVTEARRLLDPADTEASALVASLHAQKAELTNQLLEVGRERQVLAEERTRLEQDAREERRAKLRELDKRLEETIREFEKKWERIVEELRATGAPAKAAERAKRKTASLETAAREDWNVEVLEALREATPEEAAPARALAAGDKVRVRGLSTLGRVSAVLGEEVEVEVGRLRMRVHPSELGIVEATKGRAAAQGAAAPRTGPYGAARTASPRFENQEIAPLSEPLTRRRRRRDYRGAESLGTCPIPRGSAGHCRGSAAKFRDQGTSEHGYPTLGNYYEMRGRMVSHSPARIFHRRRQLPV
ncbi:MAG: hypothetical protein DMG22_23515 [Acidobacteria bacterium]|nr:MAG: hypothetical protein DMG22_23515 [Acidobacteriota bacterium]